jgi:uncharacterized protein (DUF924 family)
MTHAPSTVLDFWFKQISPDMWWKKDHDFDLRVRTTFLQVHQAAAACELSAWRDTPEGRLAEIIVLDQFSRNMFRDTPGAFAFDPLALALAQEAVRAGVHSTFESSRKMFLFMPYMHSESKQIHETAVKLFGSDPALKGNLDFELRHKAIIDRFGRYPHRNIILGRPSTPDETEFLKEPGSSF